VLNNGWSSFTFYCPDEYTDCLSDMTEISTDNSLLTNINNFVHPFNTFEHIKTTFDSTGEVTLTVTHLYDDKEINAINKVIDNFNANYINEQMTTNDKIKAFHDYVINNSKYDIERAQIGKSKYNSNIAYGTLVEGYSVCGGYSDAMAIYLFRLGVKNFKVSSADHVWNAVYLNDLWLHLDATWDDPYGNDGANYLITDYFLITRKNYPNWIVKVMLLI
jgi:transglutaminase/protease-like cytokinesis protein 3